MSATCFIFYAIKHSDDMKLCEKYGFAASARDKQSAIFSIIDCQYCNFYCIFLAFNKF